MRLFLHELRIFKSHNQIKFLLLHSRDFLFVQHLFLLLPRQLLLNLGSGPVLAFIKVHLSLKICILLLHLNHLLNLLRPHFFIAFILLPLFTVQLLFSFSFLGLLLRFQIRQVLVLVYFAIVFFLHVLMHVCFVRDLLHFLALALKFLVLQLHVAATLHYDVRCALASFVDFFDGLLVVYEK